jgi:hypothetical protein
MKAQNTIKQGQLKKAIKPIWRRRGPPCPHVRMLCSSCGVTGSCFSYWVAWVFRVCLSTLFSSLLTEALFLPRPPHRLS